MNARPSPRRSPAERRLLTYVADVVRSRRRILELSQPRADEACGFPLGTIAQIENKVRLPGLIALRALADGLQIPPSELLACDAKTGKDIGL